MVRSLSAAMLAVAMIAAGCGAPVVTTSASPVSPASEPAASARGTASTSLLPLPNPPVAPDGQVALTCGGLPFSAAVLRSPRGAESADIPASAALREAIRSRATRSQAGWRIAHLSDDAALFLLETTRPDGSAAWWRAQFAPANGTWELVDSGTCELGPSFPEGFGPGTWELSPGGQPTAETTRLSVSVTELACASGQSAEGRVTEPAIAYDGASVTLYFAVRALPGNHTCQGNPPLTVQVELAEPLGERAILDGSSYPPAQRWP